MKRNLQISGRFWGCFWKVITICDPVGTGHRMSFNDQPKIENLQTAQIEWEIRDFQKELAKLQKEKNLLCFQPCRGDVELRQKEETLEGLKKRIKSLDEEIWGLERKLHLAQTEKKKTSR